MATMSSRGLLRSMRHCTCWIGQRVVTTAQPGFARSGRTSSSQKSCSSRYLVSLPPSGVETPQTMRSEPPSSKQRPSWKLPKCSGSTCRGVGSLVGSAQKHGAGCSSRRSLGTSGVCRTMSASNRRSSRKLRMALCATEPRAPAAGGGSSLRALLAASATAGRGPRRTSHSSRKTSRSESFTAPPDNASCRRPHARWAAERKVACTVLTPAE
mmetsp:Transcript_90766/g.265690  ORF Transcript_90766/g.265690 Transcript_90766/m.265690 type:complete len:212 (+) Transcript_90766:289-924(+)